MDAGPAWAAAAATPGIDGASLGLVWGLPFLGVLLSIAITPLLAPRLWHHHFGKIATGWAGALLIALTASFGFGLAFHEVLHTVLSEYVPFIALLFALFVVAGGIRVSGNIVGTPGTNVAILGCGTVLASLLGTTGAAMLLIRPLIEANRNRRRNAHVFVFFIFLVSNIGGSLTPLGDPPLFLGFLQGVTFTWTLRTMLGPAVLCSSILLIAFTLADRRAWRREPGGVPRRTAIKLRLEGGYNFFFLFGIIAAVLLSGLWRPDLDLTLFDVSLPLQGIARDAALMLMAWASWRLTPARIRVENAFRWEPIQEVAILFAGIFLTMIPVLAMLKVGSSGALAGIIALVTGSDGQPNSVAYFWMTGLISGFLDNAPTYLVFFNAAGGDSALLMGPHATTLLAISAGAVFFGAITYIGNAPNFMVKSICEERGIPMPGFFGYLIWSCAFLLPLFTVVTAIFFWR